MAAKLPPGHRHPDDRIDVDCDGCGQTDNHPRHIILNADGTATVQHMDCCNCASCVAHLDHAGDKRGLELAAHIQQHGDAIAKSVAALTREG